MSDHRPARAYLSLGSNIEAPTNLPAAVRALGRYGTILRVSRVWESEPVGFAEQPNFFNAALLLETSLPAAELREKIIPTVESALHRVRDPHNRNAPRTIDIDLSLYNREILQLGSRRIPDPEILTRAFVAVPLAEVDPGYVHPDDGRTLAMIAAELAAGALGLRICSEIGLL